MGTWAWLLLFCLLPAAAVFDLFVPDRHEQPKSVRLWGMLNYSYNGDSSEYAMLVAEFPRGFQQHRPRVLRPLYPALGFLVYQPLCPLKPLLPSDFCRRAEDVMAKNGGPEVWKGVDVRNVMLAWAALIIVNFLLYAASIALIVQSLRRIFPPQIAILLAAVPALHRDTVDYLLVPSAEPFNLLLPAIFLYAAMVLWPAKRPACGAAAAIGLGMLGKGSVFLVGNWLYEHLVIRNWRCGWRYAVVCVTLFVAPMAIYLAMLHVAGVPAYNHEITVYRQFVWMGDYLRQGRTLEIPLRWLTGLATHVRGAAVDWAVPLALCGFWRCAATANRSASAVS